MRTLNFFCAFSRPPKFLLEIKVANPGVGGHPPLSLCVFNPPPDFSHIELANPGVREHPQLSVWLFIPPPSFFFEIKSGKSRSCWAPSTFSVLSHGPPSLFWKSKWQIQELVGTHRFLCAFSTRRRIFRTSNWQIQELVGTLSFLCGFSLPPPKFFFFEMKVANPGVGAHPQLFLCFFTASQVFFGNQSGKSRSWWAPSTFSVLFHGLPSFFWKSKWEIQELLGTLNFFCAFSRPPKFLLEIKVANPGVGGHRQLSVCVFNPPPDFFAHRTGKSRSFVSTLSFPRGFSFPPQVFFSKSKVANPGVVEHPQLFLYFLTAPQVYFGNQSGKSRSWWAPTAFCVPFQPAAGFFAHRNGKSRSWWAPSAFCVAFHSPLPSFFFSKSKWQIQELVRTLNFFCAFSRPPKFLLEIKVANPGVGGHRQLSVCVFNPPPDFSHIELANPGVREHPPLSVCLFTAPPSSFFWRSKWQIQELLGTLNFFCTFSGPRSFF